MSWNSGPKGHVSEYRRKFFERARLNIRSVVGADQVHGTYVHTVEIRDAGRGALLPDDRVPACDGFSTNVPELVLTTLHADCAPVFLFDPVKRAIALVHSGWRGTIGGIAGIALSIMSNQFGSSRSDVIAEIGPTISTSEYLVGDDVAERFRRRFGGKVVAQLKGRPHVDLIAALTVDLLENGLRPDHIPARPSCTYRDRRFPSYRRDGRADSYLAYLSLC